MSGVRCWGRKSAKHFQGSSAEQGLPNLIGNRPNLRAISFWVTLCGCQDQPIAIWSRVQRWLHSLQRTVLFDCQKRSFQLSVFLRLFEVVGWPEWHVDHPLGLRPCTTTIEAITSLRVFLFFFSLINFALYFSKYQGYDYLRESFAIVTTRTMMSVSSRRRCKSETLGRRKSCASSPKYNRSWQQS